MLKPKVVLLIFVSGKIVLTGAKVSSSDRGEGISLTLSCRFAKKFTRPSTLFILCSASFGSRKSLWHPVLLTLFLWLYMFITPRLYASFTHQSLQLVQVLVELVVMGLGVLDPVIIIGFFLSRILSLCLPFASFVVLTSSLY
jgi:hypothetical protein